MLADIGRGVAFAEAFERNILMPYADFAEKVSKGSR
jgi:hypothetical protein